MVAAGVGKREAVKDERVVTNLAIATVVTLLDRLEENSVLVEADGWEGIACCLARKRKLLACTSLYRTTSVL